MKLFLMLSALVFSASALVAIAETGSSVRSDAPQPSTPPAVPNVIGNAVPPTNNVPGPSIQVPATNIAPPATNMNLPSTNTTGPGVPVTTNVPSTTIPNVVTDGGAYTMATAADITLNRRVRDQLISSIPSFRNRDVRVNSRGGNVLLEGTVPSQLEADAIVNRTENISGVASVVNRLTIQQ